MWPATASMQQEKYVTKEIWAVTLLFPILVVSYTSRLQRNNLVEDIYERAMFLCF